MSRRLEQKVSQARTALLLERVAISLWPIFALMAALLGLILSGLMASLPPVVRLTLFGLFALAGIYALWRMPRIVFPDRAEALRRIDQASGLEHRDASLHGDVLATAPGTLSMALWDAHQARLRDTLAHVRAGWPRADLAARDPFALRMAAVLILCTGLLLGLGHVTGNLRDATRATPPGLAAPSVLVDGWVTPPKYTKKPPLMLTSQAGAARLAADGSLTVPQASKLTLRIANASDPRVELEGSTVPATPSKTGERAASGFSREVLLIKSGMVTVWDGSTRLHTWRFVVTPDTMPSISFSGEPVADRKKALEIGWQAQDDYGVTAIEAQFSLADIQDGTLGIAGNGLFLFDPPTFPVKLKSTAPGTSKGKATADLTAHPWAGFSVDIVLIARDGADQEGKSTVKTVVLPQRTFHNPLARALIEQRRVLIMDPDKAPDALEMMQAILIYPRQAIARSGLYLALSTTTAHLDLAIQRGDMGGVRDVIGALWDLALVVESGSGGSVQDQIDAVTKALEQALREGAPSDDVADLTKKLRDLMKQRFAEMAQDAKKMPPGPPQPGQKSVTQGDLDRMLKEIEKLAREGKTAEADRLMSELKSILKNMQPGQGTAQGGSGQGDGDPGAEAMDGLSDMMSRQKRLMDETQRQMGKTQGQNEGPGGDEPQDQGEGQADSQNQNQGQDEGQGTAPGSNDLAQKQEALGGMLDDLTKRLGENGVSKPDALDESRKSMAEAEQALREGRDSDALKLQGDTLRTLRKGALDLSRQFAKQQGERGGQGPGKDPLGRQMPSRGADRGPEDDMVPGSFAARRAREILEMLRGRVSDPNRPQLELDYLERLLRDLY